MTIGGERGRGGIERRDASAYALAVDAIHTAGADALEAGPSSSDARSISKRMFRALIFCGALPLIS